MMKEEVIPLVISLAQLASQRNVLAGTALGLIVGVGTYALKQYRYYYRS